MVLQLPPKNDSDVKSPIEEISVDVDRWLVEEDTPLVERGTIPSLEPKQVPGYLVNLFGNILAPQNLTGAANLFYRPLLFTAIGLHLLLFFAPNAKDADKNIPKKKEKPVTITKISTGKLKKKAPKVKVKAKPKLPKVKLAQPKAPVIKPSPNPTPKPTPASASTPQAKPSPLPSVSPMPPGGDNTDPNNPFADFPHIGTKNDSDEYVSTGKQLADVVTHFKQALPAKKYTADTVDENTGFHIIEFSKAGKNAYLNIFQDDGDVVYVIAGSPVTSLELWRGAAKVPDELVQLIAGLATLPGVGDGSESETPVPDDFANPSDFFQNVDNEDFKDNIGGINPRVVDEDPQELYDEHLEPELKRIFTITSAGTYGGGNLWEMKKGKTQLFLNLIPSNSRSGVAVVIWTAPPS
ncbi:hypothetical protein IQ266_26870 [filamentous cyanobacterium LEGE 11480]|uniref:Uncharacterized protein n=1 Tax=Romeriopsis navalis LEGE 11480 TaxID=2777977 RepID=A0A928Z6U7_9CYAN|nr:hypothetical protein [Romeriopsis navalis]MBE9033362.1 hypothetical protein [Romeriopsis navalis LEGE 11480]